MTNPTNKEREAELREQLEEMAYDLRSGNIKGRHVSGSFDVPLLVRYVKQREEMAVRQFAERMLAGLQFNPDCQGCKNNKKIQEQRWGCIIPTKITFTDANNLVYIKYI